MRPMTCKAGYPVPVSGGMCQIVGYSAALSDPTAVGRLTLVDRDPYAALGSAVVPDDSSVKEVIIDKKVVASIDGNVTEMFPEPIKAVNGVVAMHATNLIPGKILIYVK
jgi:hypothetical protein